MNKTIVTLLLLASIVQSISAQESVRDKPFIVKESIYVGFNSGTWFPLSKKNKVLGNPPMLGLMADVKSKKNSFGINFDLIGWPKGNTTAPINVQSGDSVISIDEYSGAQLTLDYGRELAESRRFALEGMCSIGYGDVTYYNPDSTIDIHKASMVISPGVSVRYVFGKRWFLQLKTQYCIVDYALKDNVSTDLKGHYLITKIIIGGY